MGVVSVASTSTVPSQRISTKSRSLKSSPFDPKVDNTDGMRVFIASDGCSPFFRQGKAPSSLLPSLLILCCHKRLNFEAHPPILGFTPFDTLRTILAFGGYSRCIIRAKRVSNCYIPRQKNVRVCACVRLILVLVWKKICACVRLILVLVWGTYYVPDTYVPHFIIPGT